MSVSSYPSLARTIREKNRGRKNEFLVNNRPEIWSKMSGDDVTFWAYGGRVGVLRPDNSMTVTVNGWHTQASCKIIHALTGKYAFTRLSSIWVEGAPIQNDKVELDCDRAYIVPETVRDLRLKAYRQQQAVNLGDMTPRDRMRLEMKVWRPDPCLSAKCKEYLRGNITKDKLSGRDIYTLCDHVFMQSMMSKLMEDVA